MKTTTSFLMILGISFFINAVMGQNQNSIKKERIHLDKAFEDQIGYTQAMRVGNTIYVSGTVGWGTWDKALEIAYSELEKTLKLCNASFSDVVKENIYTMSIDSLKKYSPIRANYYGNLYPTGSWIEVKQLFNPDILVEIELELVMPDSN